MTAGGTYMTTGSRWQGLRVLCHLRWLGQWCVKMCACVGDVWGCALVSSRYSWHAKGLYIHAVDPIPLYVCACVCECGRCVYPGLSWADTGSVTGTGDSNCEDVYTHTQPTHAHILTQNILTPPPPTPLTSLVLNMQCNLNIHNCSQRCS